MRNTTGFVTRCSAFALIPVALALAACGTTPGSSSSSGPQLITGTHWAVDSIDGKDPQGEEMLTVDFSADGRVSGNSGCNTFSGPYIQTGSSVRIGELMSTRRACTDSARQGQESRMLAILKGPVTLRKESNGQVSLRSDAGSIQLEPRSGDGQVAARRATFNCDGTALTVVFAEETADIIWNAGTDTLAERPGVGDVLLYESQRNVLQSKSGKPNELTWTLEGRSPRHCVAMR